MVTLILIGVYLDDQTNGVAVEMKFFFLLDFDVLNDHPETQNPMNLEGEGFDPR